MRAAPLLALLLVTVAFVGCLGNEAEPPSGPGGPDEDPASTLWAEKAVPHGDDHDHEDPTQHQGMTTPNFQVLGWDPLVTDEHGASSGDYLCGDVGTADGRDLAVVHSFGTDVAFVVSDVSDPQAPEKIGELVLENTHTYDVATTPDARYVVLATSPLDTGPDDGPAAASAIAPADTSSAQPTRELTWRWTDGCGGEQVGHTSVPYASGVVLVDLAAPESPEVTDYEPMPVLGAHSVFATEIDGTYHVLGSNTNLAHQASFYNFYTITETPVGAQLVQQASYSAQNPDPASEVPLTNGHTDGWIATHPGTGDTLGYLAAWNGGIHVVRLTDTGTVEPLGHWNDYDPDAGASMTGQFHEALPMDELWEDERHYTFVGQEVVSRPADRPTGQVIMLDTTDPAAPEPVARWTLPVDVEFGAGLQFSTHYIEVVDRTLFVAAYHGGVWAVDARPEAGPELPSTGVFIPSNVSPSPPPDHLNIFRWTPIVMDVLALPSGNLVVFDGTSGVYTLSYDGSLAPPSPEPWTQDTWLGQGSDR